MLDNLFSKKHPPLPKRAKYLGRNFTLTETCVLVVLCVFFVVGLVCGTVMWFTSFFDNYILSHFVLTNNTYAFLRWKDPPLNNFMRIHIFNYTNVDAYQNGSVAKLHVEDVGPFVYEETTQKTNIKFHANSSISYQEYHTHTFRPDLSTNRLETDRVIVPNLSVLGAAAASRESFYVTRLAVSTIMRTLSAEPFLNLAAHRFIWGYDDRLFDLAKTVMSFQKKLPFEKFGIMALRNGTSEDIITIHSGSNDISKIAQIERINGEEYLQVWGTPECNRINGSDGGFYPVFDVRQKKPVSMYFREVCRRIPLVYERTVTMLDNQVEAYRYRIADNIFDSADIEPNNQCYCDSKTCSPQGVFNISKCAFGTPASISFPHFYKADPVLLTKVTGLNPNEKKHSSYMDIHPKLGFPVSGIYRLQFNIQVKKSPGMLQLDTFDDDMYLPVAWVEAGISASDLPDAVKSDILMASTTLPLLENLLKYSCLSVVSFTFLCIVCILACKFQDRWKTTLKLIEL